jgi:DNA-binding transcriptional LysR family regulator
MISIKIKSEEKRMDIHSIETFLTIVKAKNISRAANLLFLSQATVSQRLNALEGELGFALLERSKGVRSIKLTPKGEKFLLVAYRLMDLYNDIESHVNSEQRLPLSIGYTESINIHVFSQLYKSLLRGEKGMVFDLKLRTERSTEIHKMIENRELDLGFVYSLHPQNNILITPLFREPLCVITLGRESSDLKKEYHPSELDPRHELYSNWSGDFQAWHQNFWDSSIPPYMELDSEYSVIDYLDSGELWAIVPESVANMAHRLDPRYQTSVLLEKPPARICYMISHKLPKESRKNSLKIFSRLLTDYIREETDYIAEQADLSLFD